MTTRGIQGFLIDKKPKIGYTHCDSYPSGMGVRTLKWLKDNLERDDDGMVDLPAALKRSIAGIKMVNQDETPPTAAAVALARFTEDNYGRDGTWYQVLHACQGELDKYVEARYMPNGFDSARDSIWCEWGYVINIDGRRLDIYGGVVMEQRPSRGIWSDDPGGRGNPVDLLWSIPFGEVLGMDEERFAEACNTHAKEAGSDD